MGSIHSSHSRTPGPRHSSPDRLQRRTQSFVHVRTVPQPSQRHIQPEEPEPLGIAFVHPFSDP